jgi:hypothetical protein
MPKKPSKADQFTDDEMEQMKRYGAAQLGGTSDNHIDSPEFSEGVEKELNKLEEANASKMRAAQTGGGDMSMGPTEMEQTAVKQRGAVQKQADTQDDVEAQQAQAAQAPVNAPAAPAGPAGTTTDYSAQKGAVGGSGNAPQQPPSSPAPGGDQSWGPAPGESPEEGEDEEDPASQFPP